MKAHELMIGNWVEIIQPKKGIYTTIQPSSFSVNIEKRYKPIPLTEQWLIDFGFQKYHAFEYRWVTGGLQLIETNEFWYPAVFSHPEMSHEDDQCVSLNRIQYVHELQNLFYCLTGKQLNKKPKR